MGMQQEVNHRQVFGIRRSSFLFLFYLIFYFLYLITGGFMFAALEAPIEGIIRLELLEKRQQFLLNNPCVNDSDLEAFIQAVIRANDKGVSVANNGSGEPNWSFGQSLFFASTVITTIGYGHVTPLSREGKVFCMLYAMLGIPLTLVMLTAMVERLMIPSTKFLHFLKARLSHLYQPFNIRLLHFAIILVTLVTLFVFIPAYVFAHLEPDWDFLDSLYYCFISLTTIGLGDYIPGDAPDQKYRPLYKVATTGYLLIGLVFMMLALTIYYDIPQLNVGMLFMMQTDERNVRVSHRAERLCLTSSASTGSIYATYGSISKTEDSTPSCSHDNLHIPNGTTVL